MSKKDDPMRVSMYAGALIAFISTFIILPIWFEDWIFSPTASWHFWIIVLPTWLTSWVAFYAFLGE